MRHRENRCGKAAGAFGAYLLVLLLSLTIPGLCQEGLTRTTRTIHCMGQSWSIDAYGTSEKDVLLFRGDDPVLRNVARALGHDLRWSVADTSLVGIEGRSLCLGQTESGRKTLEVAPQLVNGAVHVPSNGLDHLLDCRVSIREGSSGAVYVEPILQSISFEDQDERSAQLLIRTSVPVRKKVFKLRNPQRTVIDLVGVALPAEYEAPEHPVLGQVKIGQFKLAPSVTRIVLPTGGGVKVSTHRSLDLFQHELAVKWPSSKVPFSKDPNQQRVETIKIAKVPANSRRPAIKIGPTAAQVEAPAEPVTQPTPTENPDQRESAPQAKSDRVTLNSVEWENNRLRLVFREPVAYRWSRVNTGKKRFVVDFPGVVFPQRKTSLDSGVPGLDLVRVVQNMPEPQPVVRLVCDLQAPIAIETEGVNETILYLDFPGDRISSTSYGSGGGHTSKSAKGSPQGRTVCIDAGHGGSDPGALNRSVGINEKQVTLDIALRLAKHLKSQGWNVVMTRSSDRDVSWAGSSAKQELGARAKVANNYGVDLFVSIHANASVNSDINGTSIHWYKGSDFRLAQQLESGVMGATGRKNRGLVKNRFYVLAHTEMPAVLIETAFLTNPSEGKLLASPKFRERIARGIASGLNLYASKHFPHAARK